MKKIKERERENILVLLLHCNNILDILKEAINYS